jgi:putative endonuclease
MGQYFVYVLTNRSRTLYAGVTRDLERRLYEHRHEQIPGFTTRYNATRPVYCETTSDVRSAISREKQIKSWRREKKIALIQAANPTWKDLGSSWRPATESSLRSEWRCGKSE